MRRKTQGRQAGDAQQDGVQGQQAPSKRHHPRRFGGEERCHQATGGILIFAPCNASPPRGPRG
jgi:hypothetical protein